MSRVWMNHLRLVQKTQKGMRKAQARKQALDLASIAPRIKEKPTSFHHDGSKNMARLAVRVRKIALNGGRKNRPDLRVLEPL